MQSKFVLFLKSVTHLQVATHMTHKTNPKKRACIRDAWRPVADLPDNGLTQIRYRDLHFSPVFLPHYIHVWQLVCLWLPK